MIDRLLFDLLMATFAVFAATVFSLGLKLREVAGDSDSFGSILAALVRARPELPLAIGSVVLAIALLATGATVNNHPHERSGSITAAATRVPAATQH